MAVIVYRRQPWAFVDELVARACPPMFSLVPMARDASQSERFALLDSADFLMGSWVTTSVTLTEGDYGAAPRLKLVQLMSAGYEHVDLDLAARFGVPVATFGDAMASVVAEHTLMLMLAVYRRLLQLDGAVRSGAWRTDEPPLRELSGKRVGLIGLGYIGRAVAQRLHGFGCDVRYFSRHRAIVGDEAALGVSYAPFERLLCESDVVSLHVPLAASTRGLIGDRELGLMKPEAVLINTSRGAVVDREALFSALSSGRLAGAGLDVLDPEPPDRADPLLALSNAVFTPHVAGQSDEVWPRIVRACFDNIQRVARGEQPLHLARALD